MFIFSLWTKVMTAEIKAVRQPACLLGLSRERELECLKRENFQLPRATSVCHRLVGKGLPDALWFCTFLDDKLL